MGKASRRKQLRKNNEGTWTAETDAGRDFIQHAGDGGMRALSAKIMEEQMRSARVLNSFADGYFVYDLENPRCVTPLLSLLNRLLKVFGSYDRVPVWLAKLAIEEPWEQADRGYRVLLGEVCELHDAFPFVPVTPMRTWELVLQKHREFVAQSEQAMLCETLGHAAAKAGQAARI